MKQLTNEAFSPEESKKIYDNFLSIIGTRRDKLVKRYGAEAEKVAYAKAVKQVKKQAEEKPKEETMDKTEKLKEMVKDALKNPKKADLNKDGKLSDYEKKRGAAIEKSMQKEDISESSDMWDKMSDEEKEDALLSAVKDPDEALKYLDFDFKELPSEITQNMRFLQKEFETDEELIADEPISEDLDIGHKDDEPGMLKADVYRIGKYAMELYKMLDKFDKMDNEVDFPHWWQSKISKSKDMIVSAKHYLDFEMKEPQIDAMVDVASEEGVINELTPAQQRYVDMAASKPSKPKKTKFRKDIEGAKRMIDAGRAEDEVINKYGIEAFNAVNAENEYLEESLRKKLAETFLQKLHEDPDTTRAVNRLEPILLDILNGINNVDKSQDDTEKDVEELDTSIDYLASVLTNKSPIDVAIDQQSFQKYTTK